MEQIGIALFGVLAVYLSQATTEQERRWACVFGMLGQPFWFYSAWVHEQWGIFALCFLYTYSWWRGVRIYWLNPYLDSRRVDW